MITATCKHCGTPIEGRAGKEFCSEAHRKAHARNTDNPDVTRTQRGQKPDVTRAEPGHNADVTRTLIADITRTDLDAIADATRTAIADITRTIADATRTAIADITRTIAEASRARLLSDPNPVDKSSTACTTFAANNPDTNPDRTRTANADSADTERGQLTRTANPDTPTANPDTSVRDNADSDELSDDDRHEATLRSIAVFYREAGHPITRDQASELWGYLMALAPNRNGQHVTDDERWCLHALRTQVPDPLTLLTPARRRGTPQPPPVDQVLRAANGPGYTPKTRDQAAAITARQAPAARFQVADAIQQAKIRAAAMGEPDPAEDRGPAAGLHGPALARAQLAEHARSHPAEHLVIANAQDNDAEAAHEAPGDGEPEAWPDDDPPPSPEDPDDDIPF
jgi:uncharacterized Zn finger protein (UPF0148 family)